MKDQLVIQLVIFIICGSICSAIASSKGRNVVGWFFGGLLGLIGIIIVACLPNLIEKKRREDAIDRENRRLREQLYQEQMKAEAFRRHAAERLDVHDVHLGLDTRSTKTSLAGPQGGGFPLIGQEGWIGGDPSQTTGDLPFSLDGPAAPSAPPVQPAANAPPARQWFYAANGQSLGPINEDELVTYIRNRHITPQTLVWTAQLGDWKQAGQVAHLQQWMGL